MTCGKEILWTVKSDRIVADPYQSFDTRKIFCNNYSWKSNAMFQILSWLTWLFPAASAARSFVCFKSSLFKRNTILHKTFRWTILSKLSSIYFISTDPGVNDMGRNTFQLIVIPPGRRGGGVLYEFLGGDGPLGSGNPSPIPELIQLDFVTLYQSKLPKSPLS